MKHLIIFLLFPFLAAAQPIISCTDVIKPYGDFQSPLAFEETVAALQKTLNSKGITIFATIEHHKAAEAVGESMRPATVLIVGNPKVGTALMQENPRLAIELPLKILIYEDGKNCTHTLRKNLCYRRKIPYKAKLRYGRENRCSNATVD